MPFAPNKGDFSRQDPVNAATLVHAYALYHTIARTCAQPMACPRRCLSVEAPCANRMQLTTSEASAHSFTCRSRMRCDNSCARATLLFC